jgi:branched-chain amino acid transport system permease protein
MPAKRTGPSLPLLLAVAAVMVAALALLPSVLGLFLPRFVVLYQTELLIYGMTFAIAALGFNLLLGYTGLLSFGHSAYFGAGAYTVAFIVRDLHLQSMELCILGGLLSSLLIAALFGYVCVRHTRIFFGILTLALSQVLWSLAYKFFWVTGGTDGIRVARSGLTLLGGLIDFRGAGAYPRFVSAYYYYVLALFTIAVAIMWVIVHSPFGKALQAIRDNETRAGFVGIRVRRYRWIAFVISGLFTGLAGALWVPLNGLTTPDILYWPFSGEIVFMTVLGGFRTFTGPIIGALAFNYLKVYAVASSQYWQLVLGCVLVLLVMVLPSGITGMFAQPPPWFSRLAASAAAFVGAALAFLALLGLFAGIWVFQIHPPGEAAAIIATVAIIAGILAWFLLMALIYHRGSMIGHQWLVVLALLLPAVGAAVGYRWLGAAASLSLPLLGFLVSIALGAALASRSPAERGG